MRSAAVAVAWEFRQRHRWGLIALIGYMFVRVIITVLWLASIDAVIMVALKQKASEPVMLAILAPHVPLAYLVARFAVASARRGDVPDWRRMFTRVGKTAARDPFRSAARAQAWFEWRLYGPSLPWWVAILLPFELVLLYPFWQTPELIFEVLLFVLFTPPFMAAFVAAKVGDSDGVNSFLGTRPLTDASFIAAKMKAMIWSTLASWLLVLIATPLA